MERAWNAALRTVRPRSKDAPMHALTAPAEIPLAARRRETVVLLHASASSSRQWDALAEALAPHFDVQAIDLHGHGRGPAWTGERPFSLRDDVALAHDVLERAGGGHVVGHSYGAAVATHLAVAHPGQVQSLALYEPVLFSLLAAQAPTSPGIAEAFALAAFVREQVGHGAPAAAAERFVDYWSGTGAWHAMSPNRQQAVAERMPVVAQHFATLTGEPLPAHALQRLRMPLLCLRGSRTTLAALHVSALLRCLLPQGRHEVLDGLSHMAPLTHPLAVNERLLRFLHFDTPCRAPRVAPFPADAPAETADCLG
jgi:pimeloyl-ACP methyl ester carboxylesterase